MAYKGFDLTGKVALVTGGNGGIGFGMADAMAEAGADVCIWGTRKEKTDAAAEKLKRHGRKVHAQIVDVGDEKQVIDAFAETVKVLGHVDNCVANAGVSGRVPQMQTSAPASAMASAMPKPIPPLPPVTSATLPVRSKPL